MFIRSPFYARILPLNQFFNQNCMKKVFISLLIGLFAFSATAFADFSDVDDFTDYRDSIIWMNDNGVIDGYPDGSFQPDTCVNRVEFLKLLFEVLEIEVGGGSADLFSDTPNGSWYEDYVRMARERGTVVGYSDGTFRPGQCVNRVEAMKMAVLEFNDGAIPETDLYMWEIPADVNEGEWYFDYLEYVRAADLVGEMHTESTVDGFNFFPGDSMSRKEVAEMLYRMKSVMDTNGSQYRSWVSPDIIDESLLFFRECSVPDVDTSNVDMETIFPKDSGLVMVLDASNSAQVSNWNKVMDVFPSTGENNWIVDSYDDSVSNKLSYANMVRPVTSKDWKFGMSLNADFVDNFNDGDVFVGGKFEAMDEFEYLAGYYFSREFGSDMSCEEMDDFVYWTSEYEGFYAALYGDLFLLSNSAEGRDAAIARVASNDGFTSKSDDDLAYMYINDDLLTVIGDLYTEVGMEPMSLYFSSLMNASFSLSSDGEGVSFDSSYKLETGSNIIRDLYEGYELELIEKVPAEGTIFYIEMPSFSGYFAPVLSGLTFGDPVNSYAELLNMASDETGIDEADLEVILDSPFAVQISDLGNVNPGFAFYLQLDSSDLDAADNIVEAFDVFIEANTEGLEFDNLGSGLRRISVAATEIDSSFADDEVFEFYYGVMDDDVMVFALYSDFDSAYGDSALARDGDYQEAKSHLGSAYGAGVLYLDIEDIVDYFERNLEMDNSDELILEEIAEELEMIMEYVDAVKYVISSSVIDRNELNSSMYVKIEN